MILSNRPTYMEVNISNFLYNIEQIKNKVGPDTKLMPVVKANAYGTYINSRLEILNQFDIVAVATVDEAIDLRKQGYEKEIFILNQPYIEEIDSIAKANITIGVCEKEFLIELGKHDAKFNIHIEIETGMGRTGIYGEGVEDFIKSIPSNVNVEGVYTHFSSADIDDEYTKMQIEKFNNAVQRVKSYYPEIKYVHASASDGIMFYNRSNYNLVRPGLIMYGYSPVGEEKLNLNLKPVAKLKSRITFIKEVEPHTSIGYARSYNTNSKARIATIPIGYADGFRRAFSNRGKVFINGKYAPIVGMVCMDSIMCDITYIDCKVGDEVIIWDNDNIKLEELANMCDTINYEIISCISSRVPRKFIS